MNNSTHVIKTPWDSKVFGIPTYELLTYSEESLNGIKDYIGHITLKLDPLADKKLLYNYGFYYADTLLEPYCKKQNFIPYFNEHVKLNFNPPVNAISEICFHNTFAHGRFHKDYHLTNKAGDLRYASWLEQLHSEGKALALMYDNEIAGFFCVDKNKIPLHAITKKFRSKGLAKYFWSAAIKFIFESGYDEVSSSVSASNLPVINLYISLGFTFKNAVEIYHKFNVDTEGRN